MKYLKWATIALAAVVVLALGAYGYAVHVSGQKLSRHYRLHDVDFPVPWPLTDEERAGLAAAQPDADLEQIALEWARQRGQHLIEARYGCTECHGKNFGGGTMVDDPLMGSFYGPNLTTGKGGVTIDFTVSDWDHIVRHGVKPDGTPAIMPSAELAEMSDRELSDIITYIRSRPPVDNEMPPSKPGPLGKILVATDELKTSAELIDHEAGHRALPPAQDDTLALGGHLSAVCTGCHGKELRGGPIPGGDPSWPPAANLTPQGIGSWSFDDFERLLRIGERPDGTRVAAPMESVIPFGAKMSDTELRAIFAYLKSLPPAPTPK